MAEADSSRCRRCGETKPLTAFSVIKKTGKINSYCKACRSALAGEYAAQHRDEKKQYNAAYRQANVERLREYDRQRSKLPARRLALRASVKRWQKTHIEMRREIDRRHYWRHREQILAQARATRVRKQRWTPYVDSGKLCSRCNEIKPLSEFPRRSDNRAKARHCCSACYVESIKPWREAHPETIRAAYQKIRAKRSAAPGTHTAADIRRLFKLQRGTCAYCPTKLKKYHVDHVMPLARGGSNGPENLQLLCPMCNLRKGARHPLDFARMIGKLL